MIAFRISYYDNSPDMYVRPLTGVDGEQLVIYETNPQSATATAKKWIGDTDEFNHHKPFIRHLTSCVHEDYLDRWREGDPEVLW